MLIVSSDSCVLGLRRIRTSWCLYGLCYELHARWRKIIWQCWAWITFLTSWRRPRAPPAKNHSNCYESSWLIWAERLQSTSSANAEQIGMATKLIDFHCRHQKSIMTALKDADVSIRRRAMDLLFTMCSPGNVRDVVQELLDYLELADFSMREELVSENRHPCRKVCLRFSLAINKLSTLSSAWSILCCLCKLCQKSSYG